MSIIQVHSLLKKTKFLGKKRQEICTPTKKHAPIRRVQSTTKNLLSIIQIFSQMKKRAHMKKARSAIKKMGKYIA